MEDLPTFEAYMVQQPNISLRELAVQLDASLEEMALYNNIDISTVLKGGQWLLVPRERLDT